MDNKWGVKEEQARVLDEIERSYGKEIRILKGGHLSDSCINVEDGNVVVLHLEGGGIESLPDDIGNLRLLRELSIKGHDLGSLPDSFGGLESLERCGISFCKLEELPETFGNLQSLKFLNLIINDLRKLPE